MHDRLSSFALEQLTRRTILELQEELGVPYDVLTPVLSGIAECIHQMDRPEVFLDGTTNIFNYPEFRDVMKAREFLTVLDEKAKLFHLLNTELSVSGTGINVKIGTENELNEIKDCSLITATYSFNNTVIGSIGVIGPTRMDYSKVISSMDYVRNKINQEIFKMLDERRE
jgi:heat-inducible transcriptional repressor